ncbi:hypothetical protein N184_02250 [Sinorhizobium sp. GL28]|jgi:hypothetical protein|nr:hypothetical protein N183_01255 [Sinorhizobium sp. Sb3]KSV95798.1 hypothetical protein N184_02250 [Sinorhizobium sp. GL28]
MGKSIFRLPYFDAPPLEKNDVAVQSCGVGQAIKKPGPDGQKPSYKAIFATIGDQG